MINDTFKRIQVRAMAMVQNTSTSTTNANDLLPKVKDWGRTRYDRVMRAFPWPELNRTYNLSVVSGTRDYALRYDLEAIINDLWQNSIPLHWLIRSYFLSENVDRPNMENFAGMSNPVIDFLTEGAIAAKTAEDLAVIGQALDRILLWSFFVVPGGYPVGRRMVYWDRFGYLEPTPELKTAGWHETWWFDEEKSARVDTGIAAIEAQ